jgi:Kelch motif
MNRCRCVPGIACVALLSSLLGAWTGRQATWTPLTNLAPGATGTMLLLTDGTVMVQGVNPGNNWMQLVPDANGSYINGTWSDLASMSIPRLYYASHVLPNGQVWLLGGEYSGFALPENLTNTGEKYDPLNDSWSPIATYPEASFGDDPSMLLNGGQILAGSRSTNNTYLYDVASDSWAFAASKFYDDRSDEEGWVKLADGRVLTYDIFFSVTNNGSYAEIYDPGSNSWSSISPSDGTANGFIPQLSSANVNFELGPLIRLRGGRVFVIGATGHTALYTPSTNTWAAGPDILGTFMGSKVLFGADDAPAALMPNGHVLFAADAIPTLSLFSPPTQLFDFDPFTDTISSVHPPIPDDVLQAQPSYVTRMLVLPTGQVLFSDPTEQLWIYTPEGAPNELSRPQISKITYEGGGIFILRGKQLNGQSAGSAYGDDVESDENYPIVQLTSTTGQVFYARTTNWSSTSVGMAVRRESVDFTLHPDMRGDDYSLIVSGAGISSNPVVVHIDQTEIDGAQGTEIVFPPAGRTTIGNTVP